MHSSRHLSHIHLTRKALWPAMIILLVLSTSVFADVSDINAEVDRCSAAHDYDPAAMDGKLGPNELGKNERPFLECVYSGIEKNVMPKAMMPPDYDYLIRQHKQFTDAVEKGEITRQQRRDRTRDLLNKVKQNEIAEAERRIQDLSAKRDQFMREQQRMRKRNPRLF